MSMQFVICVPGHSYCIYLELRTVSKWDNKIGSSGINDTTSESNWVGWVCGTVTSGDECIERIGARAPASKISDEYGRLPSKNKLARADHCRTSTVGGEQIAELSCIYATVIIND